MFYKKKSFYISIIVIIVVIIIGSMVFKKPPTQEFTTALAIKGTIKQEVSVTGSVKPAEEVELALEKSGKVVNLKAKVGNKVKKNQALVYLNSADLSAQYHQAQAGVETAKASLKQYEAALATQKAKLDELKAGTRPEEIQIAQTNIQNAQKVLADAETNLQNVTKKADADLEQDYQTALNSIVYSVTVAENTIYTLTDLQQTNYYGSDQDSTKFISQKERVILAILGQSGAGRWSKATLSSLYGGAKQTIKQTQDNPTQENIANALFIVKNALLTTKDALNNMPITSTMSSTDITTINSQKTAISTELTNTSNYEQALLVQKITNQNAISTAQTSVNTAKNSLLSTQDQLKLKQAGYTLEQIQAQEAQVASAQANVDSQKAQIKSAQANVSNYSAQISKGVLTSPMTGTITEVNVKLGEIVTLNSPIIKIISEAKYQIEANIPEVDIANIKIKDEAIVTLDAYGSEQKFTALVVKIDPAETLIDNVPTYKVTFEFNQENEIIRSGMTANLDILTNEKNDVIYIPQRSVLKNNGNKIVRVLNSDGLSFTEIKVQTGLKDTNGNIEIIEGINEGDNVVLSIKEN